MTRISASASGNLAFISASASERALTYCLIQVFSQSSQSSRSMKLPILSTAMHFR